MELGDEQGAKRFLNPSPGYVCDVVPANAAADIDTMPGFAQSLAFEEISMKDGKVDQANFNSYPILPPQKMPQVHVQIINSGEALGGIGEPGTPPIAPAVCNALFTLTGQRIRSLPLSRYTFT